MDSAPTATYPLVNISTLTAANEQTGGMVPFELAGYTKMIRP